MGCAYLLQKSFNENFIFCAEKCHWFFYDILFISFILDV